MNRNRLFSLILMLLLFGLAACAANVPIPGPDPDEIELDPDVVDIYEGGSGTAILNIEHSLESVPGTLFKINESFTIYVSPVAGSRDTAQITGETEGLLDFAVTAPIYGGGSHTTSTQVPVSFTVEGWFYPYPRCEFELEITEYIAYSEATWEDTLLGTLPGTTDDSVTFFEKITLSGPDYSYVFPSSVILSVSVDTVILDGDTGCTFLFNE